jgi:hypothetical protein
MLDVLIDLVATPHERNFTTGPAVLLQPTSPFRRPTHDAAVDLDRIGADSA